MDAPQVMPTRRCPQCEADVGLAATNCWLCCAKMPPLAIGDPRPMPPQRKVDESPRPLQYGISSLLLAITFAAIICSLIKMNPGLGIVAAILTIPAAVRTILVAFRRQESGAPMSTGGKASVFLLTVAMSLGVAVAACTAFCATFFLTCSAVLMGGSKAGPTGDPLGVAFVFGSIAAVGVAIAVTFLFWRVLRRNRTG
jgi:hypothetical protein